MGIPESDYFNLSEIQVKTQRNRPKVSNLKEIIGLDTETDINSGDLMLICMSDGQMLDLRHDKNFNTIIKFLFEYKNKWIFTYNLRFDVQVILKTLPNIADFAESYEIVHDGRYKIKYIKNKNLSIRDLTNSRGIMIYDLLQYYKMSLNKASEKYLKEHKLDIPIDQFTKKNFNKPSFWSTVKDYCLKDSVLCKKLGDLWAETWYKTAGFYPKHWYSTGYISEQYILMHNNYFNKFTDVPYDVQDMAWKSYYGGRFEIGSRGSFKDLYLYDVNSMYPWAMTLLPDFKKGIWIKYAKNDEIKDYGFYKIRCNFDVILYAPFPFRFKQTIYFPVGEFQTVVTGFELNNYMKHKELFGKSNVTVVSGYGWTPHKLQFPLKKFIETNYAWRIELKKANDEKESVVKIVLNSLYGKMAQRVMNVIGNMFCPAYATLITGISRAKLYSDSMLFMDKVHSYATDSILSSEPIDLEINDNLGAWKFEGHSDGWILMSGIYKVNNKVKTRGFGATIKSGVKGDFNPYDCEYFIDKDGSLKYKIHYLKLNNIKECVIQKRPEDIGKITEEIKDIKLNGDIKRFWINELKSIYDVDTSIPLDADIVIA